MRFYKQEINITVHFYCNLIGMKSFSHHNYFLKDKWTDQKHTKNHPKNCQQSHSFCNFDYEWAQQRLNSKIPTSLINPSIPNITLPANQQRLVTMNYDAITEQGLDDWIAQSLNRNISSILNPQKKFYIPTELQDDMKQRYRNKSVALKGDEDVYFGGNLLLGKKNVSSKKGKQQVNDLVFDYKNLQAKVTAGTPIRLRQNRYKKPSIRRRNAVFLDQDIHYSRMVKQVVPIKQPVQKKQRQTFLTQTSPMFYSYNMESLKRQMSTEQTPASITEKEYTRLKQPPKDVLERKHKEAVKLQTPHEKFRENINANSRNTEKKIIESANSFNNLLGKPTTLIQPKSTNQLQRPSFKLRPTKRGTSNLSTVMVDTKQIGKDRMLQKKVLSLLNDMQIMSEGIDFEMSELNIHLEEVELKSSDTRPQTKWVMKAQEKLREGQVQLSIDCFKQALIIQPQFFIPIFNIAILLEKQKQYFQAIRWFSICRQFQIDEQNVKFGLALVNVKQLNFQQCYQIVEQLIKKNQSVKKIPKLVYFYIRALCAKKLNKIDQSKQDYAVVLKHSKPSCYLFFSTLLFSTLVSKSRRLAPKFDALAYINFRETLELVDFTPQPKLRHDNQPLKNIAKKLTKAEFFKRFSISLVQKLLENSTYETVKQDSLIFINNQETAIILSGMVAVRNHLKHFDKPQTICVLRQGGVIGGGKIDNFINQKSNNWFLAKSDIELIKIQRKSFNEFWKGQITFEVDFKYNFLKNVGLFKNLPDSTLLRICEKIEKVEYNSGAILYNDCSYRNEVINKHGTGFGLGKKNTTTDPRFINSKKVQGERKKNKYQIAELLRKHSVAFNQMKFRKLKYPGLFILVKGKIQIEDDRGFRCSDLVGEREYFGENLLIDSDGFHNYGRMIVNSPTAELYHIPIDRLIWTFTMEDREQMRRNSEDRQSVNTVRFLRLRFLQCQNTRINYKFLLNNDRY